MTTQRPLRILMVIHTRWSRNLGAPRVQLELAEELLKMGCEISKYSYEDAFPEEPGRIAGGRLRRWMATLRSNRSFATRAAAWVRRHAGQFDVVDAHQTDLPVPKASLRFAGLLVARSVGLIPEYEAFEQWASERWPQETTLRHRLHRAMTMPSARRRRADVLPSFRHADLINVSSRDDLSIVRDRMGFGDKVVWFPFGMSDARRAAFSAESRSPAERLASRTVVFIGTWNSRKGSRDWPEIFDRLRAREPRARLLLLGTGLSEQQVRRDFAPDARHAISVIPSYESDDLPRLLANATVGAFPGYLEGFGFSVLEKLAAGLPTLAYDAPGPRDILGRLSRPSMVARGDTAGLAAGLAGLLNLPSAAYAAYAEQCRQVAAAFSWSDVAKGTLNTYRERLEYLPSR